MLERMVAAFIKFCDDRRLVFVPEVLCLSALLEERIVWICTAFDNRAYFGSKQPKGGKIGEFCSGNATLPLG